MPDLRTNLMSVSKVVDEGYKILFEENGASILNKNNEIVHTAKRHGDLYFTESAFLANNNSTSKLMQWHNRLGHLNENSLKRMVSNELAFGLDFDPSENLGICEICVKGKQTQSPFISTDEDRTADLLEIIHTDICGPMRVHSKGGAKYFITFIDDKSGWCEIYFLKKKSEAFEAFIKFKAYAENFTGRKIKFLQSDNGSEYCNKNFDEFLSQCGIKRRLTVPHTPQQNGIAERKNRTLLETARCMLLQSKLAPSFWGEAVLTANYIRNRCPSRALQNQSAFKLWTGKHPSVKHLRIFGSLAFALDKDPQKDKFDTRSKECIFLGYSTESKAYRLWSIEEQKVIVSRDVKFLNKFKNVDEYEEILALSNPSEEKCDKSENLIDLEFEEFQREPNEDQQIEMRRGPGRPRIMRTGRRGRPKKLFHMVPQSANLITEHDPLNLQEAKRSNCWYD